MIIIEFSELVLKNLPISILSHILINFIENGSFKMK